MQRLEPQRNAAAAATGQIAGRHSRITGGMGDRNLAGVRSNDGEWNLVPRRMFKRLSGSRLVRLTHHARLGLRRRFRAVAQSNSVKNALSFNGD